MTTEREKIIDYILGARGGLLHIARFFGIEFIGQSKLFRVLAVPAIGNEFKVLWRHRGLLK